MSILYQLNTIAINNRKDVSGAQHIEAFYSEVVATHVLSLSPSQTAHTQSHKQTLTFTPTHYASVF